eukprot:274134_1
MEKNFSIIFSNQPTKDDIWKNFFPYPLDYIDGTVAIQSEEQIFSVEENDESDNKSNNAACSNESHKTVENVTDDYVADYIDGTVSIQSEEQIFSVEENDESDNKSNNAACLNESHKTVENVTDDYVADYIDGTVSIQSEEQIFSADIISAPLKSTETLLNLANQFESNETFQTMLSTDPN